MIVENGKVYAAWSEPRQVERRLELNKTLLQPVLSGWQGEYIDFLYQPPIDPSLAKTIVQANG